MDRHHRTGQGGDTIPTPWWPLVLTLWIAASFASFREREVWALWADQGADAQVIFQIASWFAFGLIAAWLLISGRADLRLLRSGPLFWYACFVALALISTLYSPSPALTLFRSLQLAVAIVLVISLRDQVANLYYFIAAYVAVNWILFLAGWFGLDGGAEWIRGPEDRFVSYGGTDLEAWRLWTAFGHPSQISIVAGIAAVGLAARVKGRQWLTHGPLIAWLILTVILTVSRTALLATLVGLLIVAAGRRALLPWMAAGSALLFLILASPDATDVLKRYVMRGQSTEEFASLTGRVWVYQSSLERLEDVWISGAGFRASRRQLIDEQAAGRGVVHSHNLFLEALAGTGILGAILLAMVLASLLLAIWSLTLFPPGATAGTGRWELAATVVVVLAFCFTDSAFAVGANPFVMTFIALAALSQRALLAREE